jgi:hypothetical protein
MVDRRRLPTFIVIGAGKTGTSSLYRYLMQHPDIYMSPVKEPLFFAFGGRALNFNGPGDAEMNWRAVTSLDAYQALFERGAGRRARGEASSAYLYYPEAAQRLHAMAPDTKLIVTLRCPADRAYSNYLHALLSGREPLWDFEQALHAEPSRISQGWSHFFHYRSKGWYHRQLRHWYELFPREQIMVNLYEDLRFEPAAMLRRIFHFLNVDPDYPIDAETRYNVSGPPWGIRLRLFLQRGSPLARRMLPDATRASLKTAVLKYTTGPSVTPWRVRDEMMKDYAPDIDQLANLIGRDLSGWFERREYSAPKALASREPS